ncbi:aminoacyl-tRNA hydrolase [Patescibacteria group bacterium]|nr:aminoacyl-tRNA hydrolase [Patescibacteria group bacterium]
MKLIVGLGNPGEKYEKTRHNIGFSVLEKFVKDFGRLKWEEKTKFKGEIAQIEWQKVKNSKSEIKLEKIILLKPKTYMNNSGLSVSIAVNFYKIKPEDVWIIHDDLDIPLGALKIRFGGASAGHRGTESIIKTLGTDKFWRFRLGIGHPMKNQKSNMRNIDGYVLGGFGHGEMGKSRELVKRCVQALESALENGMDVAMNRFNSK